jgi:hypothetical protein
MVSEGDTSKGIPVDLVNFPPLSTPFSTPRITASSHHLVTPFSVSTSIPPVTSPITSIPFSSQPPIVTATPFHSLENYNNHVSSQILSLQQPLPLKLRDTNYLLWKTQHENVIIANGLEGLVDGMYVCPPAKIPNTQIPNPDFSVWVRLNRTVMSWIYASISEGMLPQIVNISTAYEAWSILANNYANASRSRRMSLKRELQNVNQEGMSVTEYSMKLKGVVDSLAEIGEVIVDDQMRELFINGLNSDYNSCVATSFLPQLLLFDELKGILLGHEMRLAEQIHTNPLKLLQANSTVVQHNLVKQD